MREVRSRRYDIHNSNGLTDTLNNMAADIELQIETRQFDKSKFRVKGIDQVVVHYDRYNPTRGGSYVELPKWIADKQHVLISRMKITNVLNIAFNAVFTRFTKKTHPERMSHYSKLNDKLINWEGTSYPAGNRDFDRLEESNNKHK